MSDALAFSRAFLAEVPPFSLLPAAILDALSTRFQLMRWELGQTIISRKAMPEYFHIVAEGKARSLALAPGGKDAVNLELFQRGQSFGWCSLLSRCPSESVIASTPVVTLALPAAEFLALITREPALQEAFNNQVGLAELYDLLTAELERRAISLKEIKAMAVELLPHALVRHLPNDLQAVSQDASGRVWLVSGGEPLPRGTRWMPGAPGAAGKWQRVIGIPEYTLEREPEANSPGATLALPNVPAISSIPGDTAPAESPKIGYPEVRGEGHLDEALACLDMVARYYKITFRREVLRRVLSNQLERFNTISIQHCGAVAELAGLSAQPMRCAPEAVTQAELPALLSWQNHLVVLFEANEKECVIGSPKLGILHLATDSFTGALKSPVEIMLLRPGHPAGEEKFSLRWFLPSIRQHKRAFIEVLVASFFVQLFTLSNPIITQVIIDKVLIQNSISTLHVLGILLVIVAVFGAMLTSLRTYLFVDTTNRIDLALGSRIIDHLYRLPLKYFQKRPVGEVSTRLSELENIRSFLTGTALTVVLDAVFSVVYIMVMLYYSVALTLVSLVAIPLFILTTYIMAPIVRRQLRTKAERQAETQSHLVETLSGIQTIKAQNLEIRSRWVWHERYSRFVSAGFKNTLTATTVNSFTGLLSKMSDLAVLWAGAYLVLDHKLTLGQLIAFRIICGYVTGPLVRLAQTWQNFQEVGLSIERLSDILDHPQEETAEERRNIPMVPIRGTVRFESLTFGYIPGLPMLRNLDCEIPAGSFVGVVGQSGSGKSTLMKLIPRLYRPDEGRILVDNYDVAKVELYSLRRQIGMVLQDSLLFDGTVQENIGLADPDATAEQIVAAAKTAVSHDFIMALSSGYNTRVGEQGRALSGGQRQRVAIARAVLQNPRLLILDEATSALDFPTERQVCLNLAAAFRQRTVFFVTHRLRSIQHSDVILYLEQGRLMERGTHDELMDLKGRYFSLYQQQETQI